MRLLTLALLLPVALGVAACAGDAADEGDGVADPGDTVTVAYQGTLEDGTEFDSSSRATFSLDQVVPGFRDGVVGMAVGETRTFTVAPEDGYGAAPPPGIPPNAVLTFEVTLLGVR